jgi:uncharacterized protein
MSISISFLIFFLIANLIVFSIHYYLWIKIVKDTGLKNYFRKTVTFLIVLLALSFPVAIVFARVFSIQLPYSLLWLFYLWMGTMMLLFFSLLFMDVIKLVYNISQKFSDRSNKTIDNDRREFISRSLVSGTSLFVLIAAGISVRNCYSELVVKNIKISLTSLPEVFKGFKIVQISDLHIGKMMTKDGLQKVVDKVNNLKPDLIVITGDLVDGSVNRLLHEVSPINTLHGENGVFFVTGNHEYYNGVMEWTNVFLENGIEVLGNKSIKITRGNDFFYLSGVNDHSAKRFGKEHAADFKNTFSGLDKNKKKILLAHQPKAVNEASEYGVDLVLSGHTHGGQIWPFSYLVYLQQPYLKGLHKLNNTQLYVNQGTGCWGPQMRLGSFNEITEIILI